MNYMTCGSIRMSAKASPMRSEVLHPPPPPQHSQNAQGSVDFSAFRRFLRCALGEAAKMKPIIACIVLFVAQNLYASEGYDGNGMESLCIWLIALVLVVVLCMMFAFACVMMCGRNNLPKKGSPNSQCQNDSTTRSCADIFDEMRRRNNEKLAGTTHDENFYRRDLCIE